MVSVLWGILAASCQPGETFESSGLPDPSGMLEVSSIVGRGDAISVALLWGGKVPVHQDWLQSLGSASLCIMQSLSSMGQLVVVYSGFIRLP